MMLKIWGRSNSGNVKKVLMTADELGLSYDHVLAGGSFGGLDTPDFLARNPNARVPLIEDGDLTLWESNTIVRYLAAQYGQQTLWVSDHKKRASAEKWMDWTSSVIPQHFAAIMQHSVRLPEEQRDSAILDRAVTAFAKATAIADQTLAKQPWLSGDHFGIGDIPLSVFAYIWFELPLTRPSQPHLENWYRQLQKRPAYRNKIMIPIT